MAQVSVQQRIGNPFQTFEGIDQAGLGLVRKFEHLFVVLIEHDIVKSLKVCTDFVNPTPIVKLIAVSEEILAHVHSKFPQSVILDDL